MPIDPKSFESVETDADSDTFVPPRSGQDAKRRIKVIFKLRGGVAVPDFVDVVSTMDARGRDKPGSINTAWVREDDLARLRRHPSVVSVSVSKSMPNV